MKREGPSYEFYEYTYNYNIFLTYFNKKILNHHGSEFLFLIGYTQSLVIILKFIWSGPFVKNGHSFLF